MAEINTTDAIPATNASNATRYFQLPLFIATDKPSWLVDWNGAMNEIDTILQDIATASEGAVADVETVVTQVNQLSTSVTNLQSIVDEAVSTVASMESTVESHEQRMDSIEQDLITQNNLIKSLSDAVTLMQSTVSTLNNRVEVVETTVAGYDSRITSAEQASASASALATETASNLQTLQGTVNTINNSVSSLNTRVTAIENQSMYPFINDLNFTRATTINKTDFTNDIATYTAVSDCYLYVYGSIAEVQGASNVLVQELVANIAIDNKPYMYIVCNAPYLSSVDPNFASELWTQRGVGGVLKVKAGTEVKITMNISHTYSCVYEIYTAPIA